MSILIKGMDMPKVYGACPCYISDYFNNVDDLEMPPFCAIEDMSFDDFKNIYSGKPDWCPIKAVRDMPSNCFECFGYNNQHCALMLRETERIGRPEWCPLGEEKY